MEVGGPQDALDNRSDDNDFDKNDNSDPVVYQLVRVSSHHRVYWLYTNIHNWFQLFSQFFEKHIFFKIKCSG